MPPDIPGAEAAAAALSAPAPGELLHLDVKKSVRFERVGHRITGDRRHAGTGAEYDCFHGAIDDTIRLAYVQVLPDEARRSTWLSWSEPCAGSERAGSGSDG